MVQPLVERVSAHPRALAPELWVWVARFPELAPHPPSLCPPQAQYQRWVGPTQQQEGKGFQYPRWKRAVKQSKTHDTLLVIWGKGIFIVDLIVADEY